MRKGVVAVELAVVILIVIPLMLIFADFVIYSAVLNQVTTATQQMASQAQAYYTNGTETQYDSQIINSGQSFVTMANAVGSINRNQDSTNINTVDIVVSISATGWQPNFSGMYPAIITKSQTIYKR